MPKPNPLDLRLTALYELELDPASIASKLPPFLQDKSNIVVAKAANMAARTEAFGLRGELEQAFARLLANAAKLDAGCLALTALSKSLVSLELPSEAVYLAGLHHFQWSPGFGGSTEIAGELRGLSARGLVRMGHPEALLHILPLLQDTVPARIGAVRAMAETGKPEAELLLRLHVLHGDPDPEVLGECFTALLGLIPQRSLEFVGQFIRQGSDEVAESAALALGESRLSAAFALLRDCLDSPREYPVRRGIMFALSMLRRDEAFDFLLNLMERQEENASLVISALAIHKTDSTLRSRVSAKLEGMGNARLRALLEQDWR